MIDTLTDIVTIEQFADEARDIVNRFGLTNAVELSARDGGKEVRVFELLTVCGTSQNGDVIIEGKPPRWLVFNRHDGEMINTPDARWGLCCFLRAYVQLINEIEEQDAQLWDCADNERN